MPDHPNAAVTDLPARLLLRAPAVIFVAGIAHGRQQARRPQRFIQGITNGVELVISRHLFDQGTTAVIVKDNEVADQRQEPSVLADTLEHDLQPGQIGARLTVSRDGAPRFEPLLTGAEGAHPGINTVGDHEELVYGEQGGQLRLVGLELLPRGPDGGVLIHRVLQLDDAQGQAIDEQDDVRSTVVAIFRDGELVDRQPVVGLRIVKSQNGGLDAADGAVVRAILHRNAVDQHLVEGAVPSLQGCALRMGQPTLGILQRCGGKVGVQSDQGIS